MVPSKEEAPSVFTTQQLMFGIPIAALLAFLLVKTLLRIAVVVAVIAGIGFVVLGPLGYQLPAEVQSVVSPISTTAQQIWHFLRNLQS